jgi:colanic acid biosynthesis glycosyl transferase WcaI
LRILIVTQYFWPESFRINDLALGLRERGHEVTVLTGMPNYPAGRFFPGYGFFRPARDSFQGIPVLRVPLVPRGQSRWRLAFNYAFFALSASVVGALRCRGTFDVIFVFEPSPVTVGLPAVLLRWLKKVPVLFWVQDLWPESVFATGVTPPRHVMSALSALVRFIYRRCDRVLVQSEGFVAPVCAAGADPAHVIHFANWAEALYKPVAVEADAPERAEMPAGFRVMFAGNIGAAQSFETVLAAADKLRGEAGIHWMVLGDGRQRAWMEERVAALGLQSTFHYLGSRPVEAMPRYFALADALLVTLRRDPIFALTVPTKLQSYLACGRPVVGALDGEGARIIEEAGAGLVVPAEDAEALAGAVLRLARTSAAERQAMEQRARAYFEEHFERERLIDHLQEWMGSLVEEYRRAR